MMMLLFESHQTWAQTNSILKMHNGESFKENFIIYKQAWRVENQRGTCYWYQFSKKHELPNNKCDVIPRSIRSVWQWRFGLNITEIVLNTNNVFSETNPDNKLNQTLRPPQSWFFKQWYSFGVHMDKKTCLLVEKEYMSSFYTFVYIHVYQVYRANRMW